MTKDEELAKYMSIIEQYKEQMTQLETQSSYLQAAINDYNRAKITIEKLNNVDKDTELFVPIGGSTFINATTNNTSKVLFDIGGGIVTEKASDDAIKKIDQRVEDLHKTQDKIMETIQKLQNEATEISAKAQQLLAEKEKE